MVRDEVMLGLRSCPNLAMINFALRQKKSSRNTLMQTLRTIDVKF